MGLIKAALGSVGGTLADEWKEFFTCDSLDKEIMAVKGHKQVSRRSSNTRGNDNVISNGSGIVVADGQCMLIVEQGKIVDVCAEPGEFTYDTSTEPSIFTGPLGKGIIDTFKTIGKRFTFGGEAAKDQRVYYINTKELIDNKFGTPNPVPFRVIDRNIGLDVDISVRCNGVFSFKVTNPLLFYTNVCANVSESYDRSEIMDQLKSEFLNALQPAFAKISESGVRYSAIPAHTMELSDAMQEILTEKWTDLRGLSICSVGINSITAPKEDEDMIKQLQKSAVMRDPGMAAAVLTGAQTDAMRLAAANENGAMMGFMGMGMANQAGGMNAQGLYEMSQRQNINNGQSDTTNMNGVKTWKCACGADNTGKFCSECGLVRPAEALGWTCSCGTINKGRFCSECGKAKPAGAPLYKCDKCGWEPEDPANPPKFCPECGDIFNSNDERR